MRESMPVRCLYAVLREMTEVQDRPRSLSRYLQVRALEALEQLEALTRLGWR